MSHSNPVSGRYGRFHYRQVPVLDSNYVHILHDPDSGSTVVIDPGIAKPVEQALEDAGWVLTDIFITHHHDDHIGGVASLASRSGCNVIGAAADRRRITGITQPVEDGAIFEWGGEEVRVLSVPGHTNGHVAYHFTQTQLLFSGDTLFLMGCGRLFEGTPSQMSASLNRLAALPDETLIFCGHEYTQTNGRFAQTIEPNNDALRERMKFVDEARTHDQSTVPASLALEKETNPFLRVNHPAIRRAIGNDEMTETDLFAELRRRKDRFR